MQVAAEAFSLTFDARVLCFRRGAAMLLHFSVQIGAPFKSLVPGLAELAVKAPEEKKVTLADLRREERDRLRAEQDAEFEKARVEDAVKVPSSHARRKPSFKSFDCASALVAELLEARVLRQRERGCRRRRIGSASRT